MATEKSTNPVAVAQATESLEKIMDLAMSVRHLFEELIDRIDDPHAGKLELRQVSVAIAAAGRDLASNIGFHADCGTKALGGVGTHARPEHWLVGRSYAPEASHG